MRQYLILSAQQHLSFKKAELEALSILENVEVDLSECVEDVSTFRVWSL